MEMAGLRPRRRSRRPVARRKKVGSQSGGIASTKYWMAQFERPVGREPQPDIPLHVVVPFIPFSCVIFSHSATSFAQRPFLGSSTPSGERGKKKEGRRAAIVCLGRAQITSRDTEPPAADPRSALPTHVCQIAQRIVLLLLFAFLLMGIMDSNSPWEKTLISRGLIRGTEPSKLC
ncbi:hypothetical protein EYF80_042235 [Liparis tanakae]|uniref:Uncharacterized protein n=1 Tax=Liparis tanakae TaxID=230148 RepID=A0A4Z2G205_9TELE|nr:hypothetical protein EYF80_042235 [Liparis tanakae]